MVGKMINSMDMVDFFKKIGIFMKENEKMVLLREKVNFIQKSIILFMKEILKNFFLMEMEK